MDGLALQHWNMYRERERSRLGSRASVMKQVSFNDAKSDGSANSKASSASKGSSIAETVSSLTRAQLTSLALLSVELR